MKKNIRGIFFLFGEISRLTEDTYSVRNVEQTESSQVPETKLSNFCFLHKCGIYVGTGVCTYCTLIPIKHKVTMSYMVSCKSSEVSTESYEAICC